MRYFSITANIWHDHKPDPVFVPRYYIMASDGESALNQALAVLFIVQTPPAWDIMAYDSLTGRYYGRTSTNQETRIT